MLNIYREKRVHHYRYDMNIYVKKILFQQIWKFIRGILFQGYVSKYGIRVLKNVKLEYLASKRTEWKKNLFLLLRLRFSEHVPFMFHT